MKSVYFFCPISGDHAMAEEYFNEVRASLPINKEYFSESLLMTVDHVDIPGDLEFNKILRLSSRHRKYPHYLRVKSWQIFVESKDFDEDTVFLDADIVLNRDISDAFSNNFGVAFTAMPSEKSFSNINTGAIFVKHALASDARQVLGHISDLADVFKYEPDPRFPQFRFSGEWGLDEMAVNAYFLRICDEQGLNLRKLAEETNGKAYTELTKGAGLIGKDYNCDYRTLDADSWGRPSGVHFAGRPKDSLFKYSTKILEKI